MLLCSPEALTLVADPEAAFGRAFDSVFVVSFSETFPPGLTVTGM